MWFAGGFLNMNVVWLVAMIVLLVVEAIVPGLISIWFAVGALGALIASLAGATIWLQVFWFFFLSVVTLIATRPLAKMYINSRVVPTNADAAVGKTCLVTETIDNVQGSGAVTVGGKVWSARMEKDGETAKVGEQLRVVRIEGVKLIVTADDTD